MDRKVLGVYLGEIETQSIMAINATDVLNKLFEKDFQYLDSLGLRDRLKYNKEHFRSVHSFLTHISNISRLIWPPALDPARKCRCEKQRAKGLTCSICLARTRSKEILSALQIFEPEHILKSRELRDHLEHFDERLDHWVQTSIDGNFIQDNIGPEAGIQGFAKTDMMRHYDPATGNFNFRGESYSLLDLFSGLQDVLCRARVALEDIKYLQ